MEGLSLCKPLKPVIRQERPPQVSRVQSVLPALSQFCQRSVSFDRVVVAILD